MDRNEAFQRLHEAIGSADPDLREALDALAEELGLRGEHQFVLTIGDATSVEAWEIIRVMEDAAAERGRPVKFEVAQEQIVGQVLLPVHDDTRPLAG